MSLSSPIPSLAAPGPPRSSRVRRLARRALLAVALVVATGSWFALDRALGTPARVAQVAASGLPEAPGAWTRMRAAALGPPTVGLQVGHLDAGEHPDELAALRVSTGGHAAGLDEVAVNDDVARALAGMLASAGVRTEILPATVPRGYRADLLLSIHADASHDPTRRGYKSAHHAPARNRREPWLKHVVDVAYLGASGLPDDDANVTGAMLGYYAFASHRYRHASAPRTPSVIVEMGYLSHPDDRAWLRDRSRPAEALADGVLRYLAATDRWHPDLTSDVAHPVARVLSWR